MHEPALHDLHLAPVLRSLCINVPSGPDQSLSIQAWYATRTYELRPGYTPAGSGRIPAERRLLAHMNGETGGDNR